MELLLGVELTEDGPDMPRSQADGCEDQSRSGEGQPPSPHAVRGGVRVERECQRGRGEEEDLFGWWARYACVWVWVCVVVRFGWAKSVILSLRFDTSVEGLRDILRMMQGTSIDFFSFIWTGLTRAPM